MTAATVIGAVPAQARFITHPTINGLSGRAGALVLVPGADDPIGDNYAPYTHRYGLIASGNTTALDLGHMSIAVIGVFGDGDDVGVYGRGTTNGMLGTGNTGVLAVGETYGVQSQGNINGGLFSAGTNVTGDLPGDTRIGVIGMAGGSSVLSNFTHKYYIGVYGYAPVTGSPALLLVSPIRPVISREMSP